MWEQSSVGFGINGLMQVGASLPGLDCPTLLPSALYAILGGGLVEVLSRNRISHISRDTAAQLKKG